MKERKPEITQAFIEPKKELKVKVKREKNIYAWSDSPASGQFTIGVFGGVTFAIGYGIYELIKHL